MTGGGAAGDPASREGRGPRDPDEGAGEATERGERALILKAPRDRSHHILSPDRCRGFGFKIIKPVKVRMRAELTMVLWGRTLLIRVTWC